MLPIVMMIPISRVSRGKIDVGRLNAEFSVWSSTKVVFFNFNFKTGITRGVLEYRCVYTGGWCDHNCRNVHNCRNQPQLLQHQPQLSQKPQLLQLQPQLSQSDQPQKSFGLVNVYSWWNDDVSLSVINFDSIYHNIDVISPC